jgi:hypothetical protein
MLGKRHFYVRGFLNVQEGKVTSFSRDAIVVSEKTPAQLWRWMSSARFMAERLTTEPWYLLNCMSAAGIIPRSSL